MVKSGGVVDQLQAVRVRSIQIIAVSIQGGVETTNYKGRSYRVKCLPQPGGVCGDEDSVVFVSLLFSPPLSSKLKDNSKTISQ